MPKNPRITAEVKGFREFVDGSELLIDKIGEASTKRFEGVIEQVAADVRARVPHVSGALAGSVSSEIREGKVLFGFGGDDVPYAGWIEFGGKRVGAYGRVADRPYIKTGRYLYPAAFDAEPLVEVAAWEAAESEIERFLWPKPN